MSDWQPMETAPKDGTCVLGYDAVGYVVCAFCASMAGWLIEGTDTVVHPTHWMPLPAPPKET